MASLQVIFVFRCATERFRVCEYVTVGENAKTNRHNDDRRFGDGEWAAVPAVAAAQLPRQRVPRDASGTTTHRPLVSFCVVASGDHGTQFAFVFNNSATVCCCRYTHCLRRWSICARCSHCCSLCRKSPYVDQCLVLETHTQRQRNKRFRFCDGVGSTDVKAARRNAGLFVILRFIRLFWFFVLFCFVLFCFVLFCVDGFSFAKAKSSFVTCTLRTMS
jgi:hypothetical protein